jgi:hypothetical protein
LCPPGAATQQYQKIVLDSAEVDAITWANIDSQLINAIAQISMIAEVACRQPPDTRFDCRFGVSVPNRIKPIFKQIVPIAGNEMYDSKFRHYSPKSENRQTPFFEQSSQLAATS